MSTLGLRLIFYFTHLCEDAELCHLRRNSSALLPILKGAPGHSKFHGRFFSRPRMSRPPVKQNMRKVYPRRKQFRTLLPSPTVPGPRRTRSSAGGLRHLTLRDRITPLSADLAAHGHTRALALKKLRRICQAEVRGLKERLTPATVKLYLFKYRERRKDRRKKWQQGYYRTNREKIGAYAVGSISSRLPKDAGGNILPTGPPFLGRRSPIMTRRRSTFLAGQPADPDEFQVEFERRNAPLPDRLIGEFHPDQRSRVRMRLVSFCQSWVEDCRRQTQNKPPL